MNRSISIFLITILLFNVLGYYGIFLGLRYTNTAQLIKKLDAHDYLDAETVTIKFPLTMPYGADARGYQRVDGEFEYNGEIYRLVKQQFQNDTLFVVCIKDARAKHIEETFARYTKTLTDKATDTKSGNHKLSQNFIKDYIKSSIQFVEQNSGWCEKILVSSSIDNFYQYDYITVIPHPPSLTTSA